MDANQEESEIRKLEGQQHLLDWVMGPGVYFSRSNPYIILHYDCC